MEFCQWEQGGIEIDNNTIEGSIDLGARRKGNYAYSVYIHNNTIGKASRSDAEETGIIFENVFNDAIVRYNYFKNVSMGIAMHGGDVGNNSSNLYIQYNIFDQMGRSSSGSTSWGIRGMQGDGHGVHGYWYIDNNVITAYTGNAGGNIGINLLGSETNSYIYIRNNIFVGFDYTWLLGWGIGSIDHLYLQNNIAYQNGSSNNPVWEASIAARVTNVTTTNLIKLNPAFVSANSDWHLQQVSPAINAGLDVGLTLDYEGGVVNNPPEIGAYEYTTGVSVPTVTTTSITSITNSSASGGGNVTYTGGGTVTVKGVCWSITANPTTSDSYTSNGSGTGSYSSTITPLSASTTYHVRAYATNEVGIGYGSDVQFTTSATPSTPHAVRYNGKRVKHNGHFVIYR
jgi:hypothetical protein